MKIHGIVVCKNESDIMEWALRDKLAWCDALYIYDNGSTDNTWDLAQQAAAREPERIFLFRCDTKPFGDGLRGEVFNHYRDRAQRGDWWCRADVDESYAADPRAFLAAVPRAHHVVWSIHVQYLFTEADMARYAAQRRTRIPEDLPRHYIANYSEPRFFRHREGLVWNEKDAWPVHMGVNTPKRIPVRHYQFRSPEQIERRQRTRREAAANGYAHFVYSLKEDWKIDDSSKLHLDKGDGHFIVDEAAMPPHIEPPMNRMIKLAAHGLGIWP